MKISTLGLVSTGVVLAIAVAGCGDDSNNNTTAQASARDTAVTHVCDKYAACNAIGSGKTYTSRDNCEVKERSSWESIWPPAECDGKVDPAQLDICIKAIDIVECGNVNDVLNVYVSKCPKAKVCALK